MPHTDTSFRAAVVPSSYRFDPETKRILRELCRRRDGLAETALLRALITKG